METRVDLLNEGIKIELEPLEAIEMEQLLITSRTVSLKRLMRWHNKLNVVLTKSLNHYYSCTGE
jgi:hypothetical protein